MWQKLQNDPCLIISLAKHPTAFWCLISSRPLLIYLHLNGPNERTKTGLSVTSGAVIGQPVWPPVGSKQALIFFLVLLTESRPWTLTTISSAVRMASYANNATGVEVSAKIMTSAASHFVQLKCRTLQKVRPSSQQGTLEREERHRGTEEPLFNSFELCRGYLGF